jgi:hypothetical protein
MSARQMNETHRSHQGILKIGGSLALPIIETQVMYLHIFHYKRNFNYRRTQIAVLVLTQIIRPANAVGISVRSLLVSGSNQ